MRIMCKYILVIICFIGSLGYSQSWVDLTKEGIKAYKNHEYDNAITLHEKALKQAIKESGKQSQMYSASLNNLGQAYKELAQYPKAEGYFLEAMSIEEKLNGKSTIEYAAVLNNMGSLYKLKGDYQTSFQYYKDALEIAKKYYKSTDLRYAMYLNNMAGINVALSNYKDAENDYLKVIKILEDNDAKLTIVYSTCLNNLGTMYSSTGDFVKAEPMLLKSAEIRKSLYGENNVEYGMALYNLGNFYRQKGNFDRAEQSFLQSLSILKKTLGEKSVTYISNLLSLGVMYIETRNYPAAVSFLDSAATTASNVYGESHPDYPAILSSLARIYIAMDSLTTAEGYYYTAAEIDKKRAGENSKVYADQLIGLGSVYYLREKYDLSEKVLLKAISILQDILGKDNVAINRPLNILGAVYIHQGDFKKCEEMLIKSLEVSKNVIDKSHPDYQIGILNLTHVYVHTKQYNKAIQYFRETVAGFQQDILGLSTFMSATELQRYLASRADVQQALQSFESQMLNDKPEVVSMMTDFRLFMDGVQLRTSTTLKKDILNSNDTSLISSYKKWTDIKSQISNQYVLPISDRSSDLSNWEQQSNDLEKSLIRNSKSFKSDREFLSYTSKNIRDQLSEYDVAVEFMSFKLYDHLKWTDSTLYGAVVFTSKDSVPVYIPLFEQKQLQPLMKGDSLRTFANLLYSDAQIRSVEHDISYGDSLYQLIWGPIQTYLKDAKNIYYSPSGLLHYLSLDAIPNGNGSTLSDKYAMHRLTTLTRIGKHEFTSFYPTSIALFGGIQYDVDTLEMRLVSQNYKTNNQKDSNVVDYLAELHRDSRGGVWNYLPGAKKEVESIGSLFNKNKIRTDLFIEKNGTEEAVKFQDGKNSADILHFSTHGFFFTGSKKSSRKNNSGLNTNMFAEADDPLLRSGLVFSGANYVWKGGQPLDGVEDGILTANEVSNLFLPNTKLVVMSACETGLGDIQGSEGVYGLQRAFKMAGVDYIIMTLWQVLDKETSEFMILFYQNLLEKKSIPDAFKVTQDVMKNKYRDEPYKWAGFVLIK